MILFQGIMAQHISRINLLVDYLPRMNLVDNLIRQVKEDIDLGDQLKANI